MSGKYNFAQYRVPTRTSTAPARAGLLRRKCACGSHSPAGEECTQCAAKRKALQRRATGTEAQGEAPSTVHQVLDATGVPLDAATRAFMEPRFGRDFSEVRVHHDAAAARSAAEVNAFAYTVGPHVVFGEGQFRPASPEGARLLAHELTHVLQQKAAGHNAGPYGKLAVSPHNDAGEAEADRTAEAVMGQPGARPVPAPVTKPSIVLQRTCADGRCEDCEGGRRDFWVTAFFRRRATRRTMDNLRREINGAKAILRNCCLDLKFDFNWSLLRGSSTFPAPTARPAGDPLGSLDYPADAEALGEGPTFSGARGVPMLVVDDVPGSGGGVTMLRGLDAEYTGRHYFAIAVNQTAPNPNCNHIAHELWHMTGAARHDPAEGAITACTSNAVSLAYCNALRYLVAPRGDFPLPRRGTGATRMA